MANFVGLGPGAICYKTGLGLSLWPRRTALLVEKEPRGEGPGVHRTGRGVSEEQVLPGRSLFRAEGVPWSQDLTRLGPRAEETRFGVFQTWGQKQWLLGGQRYPLLDGPMSPLQKPSLGFASPRLGKNPLQHLNHMHSRSNWVRKTHTLKISSTGDLAPGKHPRPRFPSNFILRIILSQENVAL